MSTTPNPAAWYRLHPGPLSARPVNAIIIPEPYQAPNFIARSILCRMWPAGTTTRKSQQFPARKRARSFRITAHTRIGLRSGAVESVPMAEPPGSVSGPPTPAPDPPRDVDGITRRRLPETRCMDSSLTGVWLALTGNSGGPDGPKPPWSVVSCTPRPPRNNSRPPVAADCPPGACGDEAGSRTQFRSLLPFLLQNCPGPGGFAPREVPGSIRGRT